MANDCRTEHAWPAMRYISTTNYDGRTKRTLWTPLILYIHSNYQTRRTHRSLCTPLTSTYFSATNHDGRTVTLWTPLHLYIYATTTTPRYVQLLALSYEVRTSGPPEMCVTRGEASGRSSASGEVIKVLASHRIFLISGRPL